MFEREVRDFSTIQRWGTLRSIHRQNLAEHSFYVTIYSDQLATWMDAKVDRGRLLRWALWHDGEETFTGDTPGPWKRAAGEGENNGEARNRFLVGRFPNREWLEPTDALILKIVKLANAIDEVLWLATEYQLGNGNVHQLLDQSLHRAMRAVRTLGLESEKELDLMDIIHTAMTDHKIGSSKYLRD